jgi:hypothetical protein
LLGSASSFTAMAHEIVTSSGRISLGPKRIARREPIWAPMKAPAAMARPIGQTTAPLIMNRLRLPRLLAALASLVWAVAFSAP